ncbi:Hypothetical protein, putative, partial [Bodo saltans]
MSAPRGAVPSQSKVVRTTNVEYVLTSFVTCRQTWSALSVIHMAQSLYPVNRGSANHTPPAPNLLIQGSAIDDWTFRLVSDVPGMPPTRGLVEVRPPNSSTWGTVCVPTATMGMKYAVCRKVLNLTNPESEWPYSRPSSAVQQALLTPRNLASIRPVVSAVQCSSNTNSTQLSTACTFEFTNETNATRAAESPLCASSMYLALDCNPDVIVAQPRLLTAVVDAAPFNESAFESAWKRHLRYASTVLFSSETPRISGIYLYVNFTFLDHSGSSYWNPTGNLPDDDDDTFQPPYVPPITVDDSDADDGLPRFDPSDAIEYDGSPGELAKKKKLAGLRASLVDGGALWQ